MYLCPEAGLKTLSCLYSVAVCLVLLSDLSLYRCHGARSSAGPTSPGRVHSSIWVVDTRVAGMGDSCYCEFPA